MIKNKQIPTEIVYFPSHIDEDHMKYIAVNIKPIFDPYLDPQCSSLYLFWISSVCNNILNPNIQQKRKCIQFTLKSFKSMTSFSVPITTNDSVIMIFSIGIHHREKMYLCEATDNLLYTIEHYHNIFGDDVDIILF